MKRSSVLVVIGVSLLVLLLFQGIVQAETSILWQKGQVKRDLNGDGKLESVVIATKFGTSQHYNTLKVFSSAGKLVFKDGFTSAGGCAVGTILGSKKRQIAVWDYVQSYDEAHTDSHRYIVTVYDWNAQGKLVETYYYRTKGKHAYDFKVIGPWQEYLKRKQEAFFVPGAKLVKASRQDVKTIAKDRAGDGMGVVKEVRQVSRWIKCWRQGPKGAEDVGLPEIWEKNGSKLKCLGEVDFGVFSESDPYGYECAKGFGIPKTVWRKLFNK